MNKISNITIVFCFCLYSQSAISNEKTNGSDSIVKIKKNKFPNTNIGKEALNVYGGVGYIPYSGNLSEYFNQNIGETMSLSYFTPNSMAYILSLSGTSAKLKQDISDVWQKNDSVKFYSIEFSVGYSLLNHINWRMTPYCGLALSESKPQNPTVKEHNDLKQFKTGLTLSPAIGMNITYKFIRPQKHIDFRGTLGTFALNMRVDYLPFAVHKRVLPYYGGIWYLSMGVCLEVFNAH